MIEALSRLIDYATEQESLLRDFQPETARAMKRLAASLSRRRAKLIYRRKSAAENG